MKTSFLFSFAFFILSCTVQGQGLIEPGQLDRKTFRQYEKALQLIREKDNKKAVDILSSIAEKYPAFYEGRYRLGWQYLRMGKKELATVEFQDILFLQKSPDYKLVIVLTDLYEEAEQYEQAISTMNHFLDHIDATDNLWDYANRRKAELLFRKQAYSHPLDIHPIALGPEVNSPYSEYLPAFNASGTEMVFTRRLPTGRGVQEDLYMCRVNKAGEILSASPIEELNTLQNEGAHCYSQDGNILIFTSCDRDGRRTGCDLYISFRRNGTWSAPLNMGPEINTRYWESQPALSADNKTLFFSSSRKGGFGGNDIWYVTLGEDGWSDPVNMGGAINTRGNEGSPFLHPDGKSFYFRSDGHIGLGDYDLFMSRRQSGKWSSPVNMGYPINSKLSEGALFVDLNGRKAYYTSNQFTEDQNLDILYFDLPEEFRPEKMSYLLVNVRDKATGEPLQSQLRLTDVTDSLQYRIIESNADGEVLLPLPRGEYIIHVDKPSYLFFSRRLDLQRDAELDKPVEFTVELERITDEAGSVSAPVILENIFFESASARLLEKSLPEIHALYRLISDSDRQLTIVGHTDDIGSEKDNQRLSEMRAKAVFDALVEMGVDAEKLKYVGKGEAEPIADNTTEAGRARNRRTEFYLSRPE